MTIRPVIERTTHESRYLVGSWCDHFECICLQNMKLDFGTVLCEKGKND